MLMMSEKNVDAWLKGCVLIKAKCNTVQRKQRISTFIMTSGGRVLYKYNCEVLYLCISIL